MLSTKYCNREIFAELNFCKVLKPGVGQCMPGFLKLLLSVSVCVRVCACLFVCMCVRACVRVCPETINNQWCDIDPV